MKPEDIEHRDFLVSMRGYARDEVDAFKKDAARAIRTLQNRLSETSAALEIARSEAAAAVSELDVTRRQLAEAKTAPAERPQVSAPAEPRSDVQPTDPRSDAFRRVALETEKILMAAEEVSEELHEKAMREAAGIVTDARLRAEKIFAEVENAKRSAQQELERIRESRSMIASQMEDIGRRLAETVARLRVPVESPQRQAARARLQAEAPRQPGERPVSDRQLEERPPGDRQAPERQAVERQAAAERQAAERVAGERQASEQQAAEAERTALERQAVERAAAERAAAEERHAAELAALQKTAELSASIRETVERASAMSEAASHPRRAAAPAAVEPPRPAKEAAPAREAAPAQNAPEPGESSSLNQLLEEIRRTRESKTAEPAAEPTPAAPAADALDDATAPQGPDPMLEQRAAALGDLPLQASRRLKRLLQEDHNDLLDRLRTRRGKGTIDENLAPLPEQFARFQTGLSDALGKAFAEGRKAAGSAGTADNGKAVSNLVARQVVNPLRAEISKAVKGGLEVQDTPTAIAERASDVFRVWKGVRTELLGEGMVYAAFNQGLIDGWSRNPKVKKLWVASPEEECPNEVCEKNVAAGPVGLKATFPSGHLTPPAHGGCTCTLKSV